MRVRKHHAWGAVLLVLFVLPVIRPQGIEALERPVASFFAWFGRVPVLNPALWAAARDGDEDATAADRALRQENAELREAYAERLSRAREVEALAEVLQAALEDTPLDRLPQALRARVLRAHDPSGFRQSLLIDRGGDDGLAVGQAVVSGATYLGRVEVVHGRSALVKLLTDPQSRLAVALRTDRGVRVTGFVRGHGRADRPLAVEHVHVPLGAGRIQVGAAVLTSNRDPLVPAGLVVGFVSEVDDKDADGVPRIRMRPAFDLARSASAIVLVPR
jgi:rod shape-determining protein MreC